MMVCIASQTLKNLFPHLLTLTAAFYIMSLHNSHLRTGGTSAIKHKDWRCKRQIEVPGSPFVFQIKDSLKGEEDHA
jgi:hypothetical protein